MAKVLLKKRGKYDEEKAAKYEGFFGHPLTLVEMRLIPYVQYCAVNQQQIDRSRIDGAEHKLMFEWKKNGWLDLFPCVSVSREFWNVMGNILFDFYSCELVEEEGGK